MAHEPRVKTFLIRRLRNWLAFLKAEDLDLSDDFKVVYRNDHSLGAIISISDPTTKRIHYFDVRVREML